MLSRRARDGAPRGARPRAHGHAAARPERHRRGAGRAARRGARARARGRQGGRRARPRAARGAARGRRGRRGRLRADRDRRRHASPALRGDASAPELEHQYAPAALHRPEHESSSFRYCTNFAVTGERLDSRTFVPLLEEIGDSVLVVGDDAHAARARAHRRPRARGGAVRRAPARCRASTWPTCTSRWPSAARGSPRRRRERRRAGHLRGRGGRERRRASCGSIEELGALVVDGGATMNPSTYELLAGIHAAPGRRGARAAQQPERDPGRRARRRAVREAGARGAHDRAAGGPRRAARLRPDARRRRRTPRRSARPPRRCALGGVAPAARDDAQGRFTRGDAVGYAGGELVAWGDPRTTLRADARGQLRRRAASWSRAWRATARRWRARAVERGSSRRGGGRLPRRRPARLVVAARGRVADATRSARTSRSPRARADAGSHPARRGCSRAAADVRRRVRQEPPRATDALAMPLGSLKP